MLFMPYHLSMTQKIEWVKLGEGGRIVVPAEMRAALGIAPCHMVALQLDGCELRLFSLDEAKRRSDAIMASLPRPGSVDDFIAERRAEAARE